MIVSARILNMYIHLTVTLVSEVNKGGSKGVKEKHAALTLKFFVNVSVACS
jgi:hypothetical protein